MEKEVKYDIIIRYLNILLKEQKYINSSDIEFILKVMEEKDKNDK